MKDLIFWEKYRPNSIKQMILIPRILDIVESGIDANLIFYGTSGTGKSTLAKIIADQNNSLYLNGKLGIEILTTKISNHLKSLTLDRKNDVKLIYIDEFDRASIQLQDGLKSFIEEYPTARFIFTTNHIDKITDELLSRFITVPFDTVNAIEREYLFNKQVQYLRAIDRKEGSELYNDVEPFKKIVSKNYPDLRASINLLQVVIKTGDTSFISSGISSTKEDLYKFILEGNTNPLLNYDYVMNNFFITFDSAYKYLSRPFFEYLKEYHIQTIIDNGGKLLKVQKEYNETLTDTLDPLVHLINYIIDLKTALK